MPGTTNIGSPGPPYEVRHAGLPVRAVAAALLERASVPFGIPDAQANSLPEG